jgi:error-prone DNA polymerase
MSYNNPPMRWSELEGKLSDRKPAAENLFNAAKFSKDGGDSPAWSPHRAPCAPPEYEKARRPTGPVTPYAELHAHSNFSFLDGASSPEELVEETVRLGLHAIGLTDHDGFYGVARLAETAAAYDMATVFGAELSMGLTTPQNGVADPEAATFSCSRRDRRVSPAVRCDHRGAPGRR